MRLWFEIARRGYRRSAAYRGATLGGLGTNIGFGFMRTYILLSLYAENENVRGYDAQDAVTYSWLTQGLLLLTVMWGETHVAERIRTGDIATDLYRPLDLQAYQTAFDLGRAWHAILFRGIAPVVVGAMAFGIKMPQRPIGWLVFALAVALGVLVSIQIRLLVNLSAFWLLDYRGVVALASTVVSLLSGFIVPLAFFPDWAEGLARMLPFAAMLQVPSDAFLGRAEVWPGIMLQAVWAAVLIVAVRGVLLAARRKVVIQGG